MRKRYIPLMTRLNCLFGAVIVLACGVLSVFSYQMNLQSHLSQREASSAALLRTMAQSIDAQMAQVEIIVQEMAYDKDVIGLLQGGSLSKQILTISFSVGEEVLRNESYLTALGAKILILSVNDSALESWDTLIYENRLSEDAFYAEFLESGKLALWGGTENGLMSSEGDGVLPYYHKVVTGLNTRIGTVRCSVRADKLFAPLSEYDGGALMVIRDGKMLFGANDGGAQPLEVRAGSWREGDNLYVAAPLDRLGASLVMRMPFASIRRMAMRDIAFSIIAISLVGVALLMIARRAVEAMLSRLNRLTKAVETIPEGCCAVLLPEDGPDEVGKLSRAFSSLLEQVNAYYDELIQKEKDKRHAQMMALQYQINPHFLFNSLYWLQLQMEESGVDGALTASIEQLGQVLHYNILGSRLALLSEEKEHILAYVGFVGAMKENHIKLSISMPPELQSARILRFTLQPLLENAIGHGYVPGNDLHIHIDFRVDATQELFEIAVRNDGQGISADTLAALQERLDAAALEGLPVSDQKDGHGTALNNLARRLALTYGSDARLLMESENGNTCARILLPLQPCLGEENGHENAGRG